MLVLRLSSCEQKDREERTSTRRGSTLMLVAMLVARGGYGSTKVVKASDCSIKEVSFTQWTTIQTGSSSYDQERTKGQLGPTSFVT